MSYVIGIDGGGTKTTGVLANEYGETIVKVTAGASNPNLVQKSDLVRTFTYMKEKFKKENKNAFNDVTHMFAGISGAGHSDARRILYNVISEVMPQLESLTIDNDAIIALYSGTLGKPGIVQISGTGSITYGINFNNERARIGGWGHFVDEKGSGYSLGHDALRAAFAAHDGTGPDTIIQNLLLSYFNEKSLPNLIPQIYQTTNPKEIVAALGRVVFEAADKNDLVALDIIDENGRHIGRSISTIIKKLFKVEQYTREPVPYVLAGGLFNRLDLLENPIRTELNKLSQDTQLIIPKSPPVTGAILAALMNTK